MLNRIFLGMLAFSLAAGILYQRGDALTAALLTQSTQAVQLVLEMTGVLCLWSGIMKAAERSGLAGAVGKALSPLTRRLFPGLSKNGGNSAIEAITMNLSANLIGLGNAATPLGLAAMERMADFSYGSSGPIPPRRPRAATDEMVVFLICNTASIQLFPSTLAAVRQSAGASRPLEILPAVWLSSFCTLAASLAAAKLLGTFHASAPRSTEHKHKTRAPVGRLSR